MMAVVTKNMTIADVLEMDREVAPIFLNNGMHCLGCVASSGESIEEACMVHGIDSQKLVNELNSFFQNK
jgi:hybrid cluster-associated redox disulfide protein